MLIYSVFNASTGFRSRTFRLTPEVVIIAIRHCMSTGRINNRRDLAEKKPAVFA
jgi:hypothetical protein